MKASKKMCRNQVCPQEMQLDGKTLKNIKLMEAVKCTRERRPGTHLHKEVPHYFLEGK